MSDTALKDIAYPSDSALHETLSRISVKVRAMGHLIEYEESDFIPLDIKDIRWGIGLMMTELAVQIKLCANSMEREDMKAARTKKRKQSRRKSKIRKNRA